MKVKHTRIRSRRLKHISISIKRAPSSLSVFVDNCKKKNRKIVKTPALKQKINVSMLTMIPACLLPEDQTTFTAQKL